MKSNFIHEPPSADRFACKAFHRGQRTQTQTRKHDRFKLISFTGTVKVSPQSSLSLYVCVSVRKIICYRDTHSGFQFIRIPNVILMALRFLFFFIWQIASTDPAQTLKQFENPNMLWAPTDSSQWTHHEAITQQCHVEFALIKTEILLSVRSVLL